MYGLAIIKSIEIITINFLNDNLGTLDNTNIEYYNAMRSKGRGHTNRHC